MFTQNKPHFNIIQSNSVEKLSQHLLKIYQKSATEQSVFEPFNVIVPSKVMGEWLKKQVADSMGISTLVTTEFWGRYHWDLLKKVSDKYAFLHKDSDKQVFTVPDVAMLSKNVMQWRIFAFFLQVLNDNNTINDAVKNTLRPFLDPIINEYTIHENKQGENEQGEHDKPVQSSFLGNFNNANLDSVAQAKLYNQDIRLWQLANDMASMFNRYMTYRPEWLGVWGDNQSIDVKKLIAQKDRLQASLQSKSTEDVKTPDWLIEHYQQLESVQRCLWVHLFKDDFEYRQNLQAQFWQALNDEACQSLLPKQIIIFTVQQLPPSELADLRKISEYVNVTLLHFNPSEQFWADIVDKNWLLEQQLKDPNNIYLKDYGHTLLSRFGKQSRELFAMLADMSGNEFERTEWTDDFVSNQGDSLLAVLQDDILMLSEEQTYAKIKKIQASTATQAAQENAKQFSAEQSAIIHKEAEKELPKNQFKQRKYSVNKSSKLDTSLSIHACHSMARQLEVLRMQIVRWLNETNHSPADILVLLPNVEQERNVIESIFPKGKGADGYYLPAKITGVVAKDVGQFWQAITGYYTLLNQGGSDFGRVAVFDWLMLPKLYESFGLNFEQMTRACELLAQAGFVRGFDESHLSQALRANDDDYRFTFAYALERLVAGLWMSTAKAVQIGEYVNLNAENESIAPLANVRLSDQPIIQALCQIYSTLNEKRKIVNRSQLAEQWLEEVESLIQSRFAVFKNSNEWLAVFSAKNALKKQLDAKSIDTKSSQNQYIRPIALTLQLNFVLQSIANQLETQQVSAEPAGEITFARMGAVRNLPYKLIVMLNMNLSEFPHREQNNRYNLMQAGISKRGDRFQEDDDLGAFLDAILSAKQACWIFYNSKSTADTHEYLPASPVQELLGFLSQQLSPDTAEQASINIHDYLVTAHSALPFDKQYFENKPNETDNLHSQKFNEITPAKIWFDLYMALNNKPKHQDNLDSTFALLSKAQLSDWLAHWQLKQSQLNSTLNTDVDVVNVANNLEHYVSFNTIYRALQNPANAFLSAQNIFVHRVAKSYDELEPLKLDNLTTYQLNEQLLQQILFNPSQDDQANDIKTALQMNDILPAGANRFQSFIQQKQQINQDLHNFVSQISTLDKSLDKDKANYQSLLAWIDKNFVKNPDEPLQQLAKVINQDYEQLVDIRAFLLNESAIGETVGISDDVANFRIKINLPSDTAKCWIKYLPTSGSEKHQLRFWLSHLCWQVARKTSESQEQQQDGFSLWQFSNKAKLYLPAIAWQTAYAQLQNWLMLYQLIKAQIIVLPPKVSLVFLEKWEENQTKEPSEAKKPFQLLGKWASTHFDYEPDENYFLNNQWQMLIGDQKPSVILPFLLTLGSWAYEPMRQTLIDLDKTDKTAKPTKNKQKKEKK